jgi:hypothetical protein
MKHCGATIDGIGTKVGSGGHQLGQKAPIAVSQYEDLLLIEEIGKKVQAAAFEAMAKGEVFEPPIGAGYEVEAGTGFHR